MARQIQLAQLYERRDRDGRPYMSGRIGTARVRLVPTGLLSKGDRVWHLVLSELTAFVRDDAATLAREQGAV
jgi:hypothetical protein